jgi:hypothetical protein
MIDSFIRGILGPLWSSVLDFYIANSLWINALLLLYALLVVLSRRTFDKSRQTLIESLQSQHGREWGQKKQASILKMLEKTSIPWGQALRCNAFPLITPPGSLLVYPKNPATFQRFLSLKKLAELLATP